MLNRQKVLLELLARAGRPVAKIELVKWCFLLQRESPTRGGPAFYEFLPYLYGPYSFGLDHELTALVDMGYATEVPGRLARAEPGVWVNGLPKAVAADADRVVRRFASVSEDELLDHVYTRYPQYTVNSRLRQLAAKPVAEPMVYTVGYEGRQVDGFLGVLIATGIRRLIDVRNNPVARRFGFHKSTLARLCGKVGIEYVHVPELGITSADRRVAAEEPTRDHLFTKYKSVTLPSESQAVRRVAEWVAERASALMCMERTPCDCHRSRLAVAVAEFTGLPIRHLGIGDACESTG